MTEPARLQLAPDEQLTVLLPTPGLVDAVAGLSPRVRGVRYDPADGLPGAEAASAQVWVPPAGGSLPDGLLDALPQLKLVQLQSAGAEKFAGRLPDRVVLCNARGAHSPATAEWVVAATLAAQRGLPHFAREQDAGRWNPSAQRSLIGARVLFVGAGDIARLVAAMMAPFAISPTFVGSSARARVHGPDALPQLLTDADVVVLLVPLTDRTRGLVDAEFLDAMADGALLVNASRGPVVDTAALVAELASGRLRAAVDVTDPEPLPEGHALWSAPNLLLTPHVAGAVPQTADRVAQAVLEQLRGVLAGQELRNVVDAY